jgi:hypothetical protein
VSLTVITPSLPERADLLAECAASVKALGLPHLVQVDWEREGPAALRNRMAGRARTPWLLFLDDDDLLLPNYVDVVSPFLADADVVYTAWELSGDVAPEPMGGGFDADALRRFNYIPVTACVRSAAFAAVGGFPDVALEDHGLWLALLDAGFRFTCVPVKAWHYRRRAGSRNVMVN